MPRVSSKNQVTLPVDTMERSGIRKGDEVAIESDGPDRIVITRLPAEPDAALGIFDGLYPPDYLKRLRAGERA
jgi:bifunctional DNA-binding transcriptional regulator/antitoxin component of YhaV-PrlF toxin-antitoxin module